MKDYNYQCHYNAMGERQSDPNEMATVVYYDDDCLQYTYVMLISLLISEICIFQGNCC